MLVIFNGYWVFDLSDGDQEKFCPASESIDLLPEQGNHYSYACGNGGSTILYSKFSATSITSTQDLPCPYQASP
jgi:hypothetical protein